MLARIRAEVASLPRVYWTVWLGTLVNKMGGVVVPFLALYLTRGRHESEATAGAIVSLYGAGTIVASVGGGVLADRVGRRATMLLSLFGGAGAMLAIGFAETLPQIAVATFVMGALGEMYRPAVSALVADVVPPADRQRAYGHLYWVINLGFAVAAVLGGLAAAGGYRLLFVLDAATMTLYGIIVAIKVPETRPRAGATSVSGQRAVVGPDAPGLATVLRDGPFMAFVLLCFGFALVMWQTGTSAPIDMTAKGISPTVYGLLSAINGVLIVLLQPAINAWIARFPAPRVLAASAVVFGAGFGLYAFAHGPGLFAVAIAIWTLGEIAHLPPAQTVVASLAPAHLRGRYQGMYGFSWGAASTAGPWIGGAILAGRDSRVLWLGAFGFMVLVAVGHLVLGARRKK